MMKVLLAVTIYFAITCANAGNTNGYIKIKDLKAFPTYLSIYLEDGQRHICRETSNTRFQSNTDNSHYTSFLLTAFSTNQGINLEYNCNGSTALVTGIRLRSGN